MKRLPRDVIFCNEFKVHYIFIWTISSAFHTMLLFIILYHVLLIVQGYQNIEGPWGKHRKIYFTTLHLRHLFNHATNCQWLHLCLFGSTKVELLGKGFWPKLRHRRWIFEQSHKFCSREQWQTTQTREKFVKGWIGDYNNH